MAKKKSGWNSLTSSQQAAWKKANFNAYGKVNVSESTIKQLRKGTMAGNIAKANSAGASAEYKEAVRRFYGKDKVSTKSSYAGAGTGGYPGGPNAKRASSMPKVSGPKSSPANSPRSGMKGSTAGSGKQSSAPKTNRGGLSQGAKWLTTPSDFSIGGAYRAATGQKPKYGSQRNQDAALTALTTVGVGKAAGLALKGVRGVRGAKSAKSVKGALEAKKPTTLPKTKPQLPSGPSRPQLTAGSGPKQLPSGPRALTAGKGRPQLTAGPKKAAAKKPTAKKKDTVSSKSMSVEKNIISGGKKGLSTKSEVAAARARMRTEKAVLNRRKNRQNYGTFDEYEYELNMQRAARKAAQSKAKVKAQAKKGKK